MSLAEAGRARVTLSRRSVKRRLAPALAVCSGAFQPIYREALGQTYTVQANFKLIEIKTKKVALTGPGYGRAGFERFQSIYANVRARDDAGSRTVRAVADDLKHRMAIYLSSQA